MKKLSLAIAFAAVCAVCAAQQNVLRQRVDGRSSDDLLKRTYITPARLVGLPDELTGGVTNPGLLLEHSDGQLPTEPVAACVLSTTEGRKASVLLDFGTGIYGGIEITAPSRERQKTVRLRVRLGESVSEAMSEAECLTTLDEPMLTATNDHSLRDYILELPYMGSVEVGNSGFRFARIDLVEENETVPIRSVRGVMRYRDIPYTGSFRCSDPRLNDIWDTGAYTVHLCMQDYLWDGVKRDRLVWLGDMHPELMTVNAVFGQNPVVPRSLDFARDNTPLPGWINGIPSYSMWWILCQRDLYLYGGDLYYLSQQRDYMRGLFRQLAAGLDGKRENLEGWRFLDWPTARMPEVIHAGYQSMLRMSLEAGIEVGRWLGDREMEDECRALLVTIDGYVPPHADNKQAAALLAVSGLEPAARMAHTVVADGGPERFSTFYGYYMLEAMAAGGMYEEAMEIISQFWGAMLDLGATTFWENLEWADVGKGPARIDEVVPAGKFDIHAQAGDHCYTGLRHSLCHGWASGPTPWLSRHVLGIEPLEPGCKKVRIVPNLGKLEWVEGSFPTPYGPIRVRHEMRKGGVVVSDIEAPAQIEIVRK